MAEALPTNTAELLSVIEKEWDVLMQTVDGLSAEQMTAPDAGGWSPKDNLAHLAAWMKYMQDCYLHKMPSHQAMGIEPEKLKQLDEDGINAVLFERNRARPAADVLQDLRSTYAEVVADLKTIPFEALQEPVRQNESGIVRVIDLVLGNTSDHFREHGQNIVKAAKAGGQAKE